MTELAQNARTVLVILDSDHSQSHVSAELNAVPQAVAAELRERMSGNICRCGAYSNIVEAITEVAGGKA